MQAHNLSSRVMSPEFQERFVRTAGINPMGFLIPASETFINLNRGYFEMEVKIQISTPAILAYNTVIYLAHHDQICSWIPSCIIIITEHSSRLS